MANIQIPDNIDQSNVRDYLGDVFWRFFVEQRLRMEYIRAWSGMQHPEFLIPRAANEEKRALMHLAKVPWLKLVVESFAQTLLVNGYRSPGSTGNVEGPWNDWHCNRMSSKQMSIHRDALRYGYSFATARLIQPGDQQLGTSKVRFRGLSPLQCFAVYEDQANDDFPAYALELLPNGFLRFHTDMQWLDIPMEEFGQFPVNADIQVFDHETGNVPIVRYVNEMELDGVIKGEVEDLIGVASCLDKTKFDRLLAQHYNSWKVRWATGLDTADSGESDANVLQYLSQSSTLASTSEGTKFGTLDETPLGDMITAYERDISDLEDTAQLPPNWSGGVANVGPDALEQMQRNTRNKIGARQTTFGDGHNQLLRLGSSVGGQDDLANDVLAGVTWMDADIRSLGQAVDAWGKAHAILGAPARALWRKIVTEEEAEEWEGYFESEKPIDEELKEWGMTQPVPEGEGANAPQPNMAGEPPAA